MLQKYPHQSSTAYRNHITVSVPYQWNLFCESQLMPPTSQRLHSWLRLNITYEKVLNTGNKKNKSSSHLSLRLFQFFFSTWWGVYFQLHLEMSLQSSIPILKKTVWFTVCMSSLIKPHFGKLCWTVGECQSREQRAWTFNAEH